MAAAGRLQWAIFGESTILPAGTLDWNLGYSYANKNQPDRRIIERQQNDIVGDVNYGKMRIDQNDIYIGISCVWTKALLIFRCELQLSFQ